MTILVDMPQDLEPKNPPTPKLEPSKVTPPQPSSQAGAGFVAVPVEVWEAVVKAIDGAGNVFTYQETLAGEIESVANSMVSLAAGLRKKAKAIRDNRAKVSGMLYPVGAMLRGMGVGDVEVLH